MACVGHLQQALRKEEDARSIGWPTPVVPKKRVAREALPALPSGMAPGKPSGQPCGEVPLGSTGQHDEAVTQVLQTERGAVLCPQIHRENGLGQSNVPRVTQEVGEGKNLNLDVPHFKTTFLPHRFAQGEIKTVIAEKSGMWQQGWGRSVTQKTRSRNKARAAGLAACSTWLSH